MCSAVCVGAARRYVVSWWRKIQRADTTEALRSLRASMLSWGKGGPGGSRSAPLASPDLPSSLEELSEGEELAASALLAGAGAASVARRRHALRIKKKSKIAFRVSRSVTPL